MKKLIGAIILTICCIIICGTPCEAAKKKNINVKTPFAVISNAKFNKKKLKNGCYMKVATVCHRN